MKIHRYLSFTFNAIKWAMVSLASCLFLYLFISIVLSIIPTNRNTKPSNEIEIYLLSNGVHLDIVLPIRTEAKDWSEEFLRDSNLTSRANYVSFGWGDRNFYINTPNWSDLTVKTAFQAVFLKSTTAMHVDYHRYLEENNFCKKIQVSKAQYEIIVAYIENSFTPDESGNFNRIDGVSFNGTDCFYEAQGSYHLFFTCNSWTNKCLKASGLKASIWTPFDKGTLYHYR